MISVLLVLTLPGYLLSATRCCVDCLTTNAGVVTLGESLRLVATEGLVDPKVYTWCELTYDVMLQRMSRVSDHFRGFSHWIPHGQKRLPMGSHGTPHGVAHGVFYGASLCPLTSSTTSVRADSSILEEMQVMWSQSYATEILRCHVCSMHCSGQCKAMSSY